MKARDAAFSLLALTLAITFIALGAWQLVRLGERRDTNRGLTARAATQPVSIDQIPGDTAAAHFRRIRIAGTWDFENEFVLTNRTRNGSPGVHIVTPLRLTESDTALLVNRGWIYSPDGMTSNLLRWREPTTMNGLAFVENFHSRDGNAKAGRREKSYRWMDRTMLAGVLPYPLHRYYAVLMADTVAVDPEVPPRLEVPPLDEGPHLNYAIQWFSFAAISIIGMILYLRRK